MHHILMRTFSLAIAGSLAGITGVASAKPDKPITAATTDKGTGCLVRDAEGAYHYDADCKWTLVMKTDAEGNITLYHYPG